jgi:hypothetical protein
MTLLSPRNRMQPAHIKIIVIRFNTIKVLLYEDISSFDE